MRASVSSNASATAGLPFVRFWPFAAGHLPQENAFRMAAFGKTRRQAARLFGSFNEQNQTIGALRETAGVNSLKPVKGL